MSRKNLMFVIVAAIVMALSQIACDSTTFNNSRTVLLNQPSCQQNCQPSAANGPIQH